MLYWFELIPKSTNCVSLWDGNHENEEEKNIICHRSMKCFVIIIKIGMVIIKCYQGARSYTPILCDCGWPPKDQPVGRSGGGRLQRYYKSLDDDEAAIVRLIPFFYIPCLIAVIFEFYHAPGPMPCLVIMPTTFQ